jgi:hypothetical protein
MTRQPVRLREQIRRRTRRRTRMNRSICSSNLVASVTVQRKLDFLDDLSAVAAVSEKEEPSLRLEYAVINLRSPQVTARAARREHNMGSFETIGRNLAANVRATGGNAIL